MSTRTRIVLLTGIALAGCFISGCGSSGGADPGDAPDTGGTGGSNSGTGGAVGGGGAAGSGTVSGTAEGHTLSAVGSAYFIGMSDDPQHTIVVYVFDAPVGCGELASPGWDTRISDGTGALEMKLIGTSPATYPASATPVSPKAGEAAVNFTTTSKTTTPAEESASSGSVTLDVLSAAVQATGSFDLTFPDGTVTGTFDAAWCPNGHEP